MTISNAGSANLSANSSVYALVKNVVILGYVVITGSV